MDEILREKYSAPRAVMISSPSKNQFFVIAENEILGEYPCFQDALFFCFAAYYVFHVEYPSQAKNILYFFKTLSDIQIPTIEVALTWPQPQT